MNYACTAVGIENFYSDIFNYLKKYFLIFDKIYINHGSLNIYDTTLSKFSGGKDKFTKNIKHLEILEKEGLLEIYNNDNLPEINKLIGNDIYLNLVNELIEFDAVMKEEREKKIAKGDLNGAFKDYLIQDKLIGDYTSRLMSMQLNFLNPLKDYNSLLSTLEPPGATQITTSKSDVLHIVFNHFPRIREDVTFENILEFRQNPDIKSRFFAFRNFISNLSREKLSYEEIEDKLEYLLNEYSTAFDKLQAKYDYGKFEALLITTAEIIESLLKKQISNLVKAACGISKKKMELLEGEKNLPGRETSYLYKIEDKLADN